MAKGIDKRSYKHEEGKLNKEVERIDVEVKKIMKEATSQKSVKNVDKVTTRIPEGVFHIDRDGNVFIKTKLGLKQVTLT